MVKESYRELAVANILTHKSWPGKGDVQKFSRIMIVGQISVPVFLQICSLQLSQAAV